MATTPHSSRNLSNISFERLPIGGFECEDVPGAQRIAALPDLHSLLYCRTYDGRFNSVLPGNFGHIFGICGGEQNARGAFVKGHDLRPKVAVDVDLRADLGRSEAGLGKRDGEAAIGEIVRGFGELGGDDLADRSLDAPLMFEIQGRGQTPKLL